MFDLSLFFRASEVLFPIFRVLFVFGIETLGGKVFWENIVEHAGWRLQKNKLMTNCRILNPEDIRVAWGGESSMRRAFDKMIDLA